MINLSQEAEEARVSSSKLLAGNSKIQNFLSVFHARWKFQVTQLKLFLLTAWQFVTVWWSSRGTSCERWLDVYSWASLSGFLTGDDRGGPASMWEPGRERSSVRTTRSSPGMLESCRHEEGFLARADPDMIMSSGVGTEFFHRREWTRAALDLCRHESESKRM